MSAALSSLLKLRSQTLDEVSLGEAEWIRRLREEALVSFEEQGFPTRRLEDWKGTNLAPVEALPIDRIGHLDAPAPARLRDAHPDLASPHLEFVDGRLHREASRVASLPEGVRLMSLADARRESPELLEGRLSTLASAKGRPMVALQTAFLDDGAVLILDAGIALEDPIRIYFGSTSGDSTDRNAAFPRLFVVAGSESRGTLAVEHQSVTPGLTVFVAELFLEAGAQIECVEIQNCAEDRFHFTGNHARLERDAKFDSHVFSLGLGTVRSELEIVLAEPNAETLMRGFYLGAGTAHVDHFTTVEHAAPSCTSDEEYRGVLGNESDGVFRGRVIVRPDAQKSDARQSNPNLLVSERARIDSKPQLEIYADDVRASHGSTIGQLDADALFFLRARGIDAANARLILTRAFAREIVDSIRHDSLRDAVANEVDLALANLDADPPTGDAAS